MSKVLIALSKKQREFLQQVAAKYVAELNARKRMRCKKLSERSGKKTFDFPTAISLLLQGKKVRRLEWSNHTQTADFIRLPFEDDEAIAHSYVVACYLDGKHLGTPGYSEMLFKQFQSEDVFADDWVEIVN